MTIWFPICPKCGSRLVCRTDGFCYCPWCGEIYWLTIKIKVGDYRAGTA